MSVRLRQGEHEMGDRRELELLQQRPELSLDHVLFVVAEVEARLVLEDPAQQAELMRHHGRTPRTSLATASAMR